MYCHIFIYIYSFIFIYSLSVEKPILRVSWKANFFLPVIFPRYRQILEKAIHFTDTDQLESLKAFVEASMVLPKFSLYCGQKKLWIFCCEYYWRSTIWTLQGHSSTMLFLFSQWSMKMLALLFRGSCSPISAHTCQTYLMLQLRLCTTLLWRRFSQESFPLRNRWVFIVDDTICSLFTHLDFIVINIFSF